MIKHGKRKIQCNITNVASEFKKITNLQFLCALRPEQCNSVRKFLQHVYELAITYDIENINNVKILPELLLEGMDEEQLWQQLEQRNDEILNKFSTLFPNLLNSDDELLEVRLKEEEHELDSNEDEEGAAMEDSQTENELNKFNIEKNAIASNLKNMKKERLKNVKKTVVDDKFFKLREMEAFLNEEDAKEMSKRTKTDADDNVIDYFAENQSDEDNDSDMEDMNYNDFFDDNTENELTKGSNNNEEIAETKEFSNDDEGLNDAESKDLSNDDEELNVAETKEESDEEEIVSNSKPEQPKSTFEYNQERLKLRIRDYEEEVLGEKPWQLKGEIVANNRPQNSLLEQVLEFESTLRPPPVITEQTTQCLEDIIRQRIKEKAWDNVELKVRPLQTPQEYRKKLVLDQEKSKQSLAQVYEAEYQRELLKNNQTDDNQNKITPQQQEIQRLMYDLFTKLDALSNYHLTPKPVAPEIKILTNAPAINIEEVAPIAISNAAFLAPEEVYSGTKRELLGKSERTASHKKRERRKKNLKYNTISKASTAKITEKKLSKVANLQKVSNTDKGALKSSKAFFAQLQDKTKNIVNTKKKVSKPFK